MMMMMTDMTVIIILHLKVLLWLYVLLNDK